MLQVIDFIRPGNAERLSDAANAERVLNRKGRDQALSLRAHMGNPSYDLLLSSPSRPSRQTLAVLANMEEDSVRTVAELTINPASGELSKRIEALFDELSYDSMAVYLHADDGAAIREYGVATWTRIKTMLSDLRAFRTGVCGHGILLGAIGVAACGDADSYFKSQLMRLRPGECQGFCFVLKAGNVIDYHPIL